MEEMFRSNCSCRGWSYTDALHSSRSGGGLVEGLAFRSRKPLHHAGLPARATNSVIT